MLKLKMMLCVMMLPLVVVSCIKAVCQSVREATASGVDNAASPRQQTPLNGIIHPQKYDTMQKNNYREPRNILMSSADRVAHISGQLMRYCEQYTRFQRSINT